MYWIRYKDTEVGAYTTISLFPGPSEVDYPGKRNVKALMSQDGALIVQRPMRDNRPRSWIWSGYTYAIAPFINQWAVLETLEYQTRAEAGLYPFVEIWEDVTEDGGFNKLDGGGAKIWTTVKFLRVERTLRKKGGGNIVFDSSTIEFYIEDPAYTGF